MKTLRFALLLLLASIDATTARAQAFRYPPLSEYLMPKETEVALAKSAAPASISDRATTAAAISRALPAANATARISAARPLLRT